MSLVPLGRDRQELLGDYNANVNQKSTLAVSWLCSEEKICPVSVNAFLYPWPFAMNLFFWSLYIQPFALKDL